MCLQVEAALIANPIGFALRSALQDLLERDEYLLKVDANERSISYRLAMYRQTRFPHYNVDCEFNPDGIDPKRIEHLPLDPDSEDEDAKTVFPDIIIHRRGTDDNLLVVEIKKSTNTRSRSTDFAKLRGYKVALGFRYAAFIEIATKDQADIQALEWIEP